MCIFPVLTGKFQHVISPCIVALHLLKTRLLLSFDHVAGELSRLYASARG